MKPPYVAFSLPPPHDAILISTLDGPGRITRNEPFELPFRSLETMNESGLEDTALLLGKYVLGLMNMWHPAVFARYPNLQMPHPNSLPPGSFPTLPRAPDGDDADATDPKER